MRIILWGTGHYAKERINAIQALDRIIDKIVITGNDINTNGVWNQIESVPIYEINIEQFDFYCILNEAHECEIRKQIYEMGWNSIIPEISFENLCRKESEIHDLAKEALKLHSYNSVQRECNSMWEAYYYVKERYAYFIFAHEDVQKPKKKLKHNSRPIWILWLQGFSNAPEIVRICKESVLKTLGDKETIILLDLDNIWEYIDLPDYIIRKWKCGTIDNAKLSDCIRLRLLNTYGGIWLDSTVLFTGSELPAYLKTTPLSFLKFGDYNCEPRICASWFMAAEPNNPVLMAAERMQLEYWKKENSVINYYLIHIIIKIALEIYPDYWKEMYSLLRDPCQLLMEVLNNDFNSEYFSRILRYTDFHKLSYKKSLSSNQNSYYEEIKRIYLSNKK